MTQRWNTPASFGVLLRALAPLKNPRSLVCSDPAPAVLLSLLFMVSISACGGGEKAAEIPATRSVANAGAIDLAADEQEIRRLSNEWLQAVRAKGASRIAFAEDAITISEQGILQGRAAIQQAMEKDFAERPAAYEINWEPTDVGFSEAGDLAYEMGTWSEMRDGKREQGHYLTVWKKIGGQWKALRDAATTQTAQPPTM